MKPDNSTTRLWVTAAGASFLALAAAAAYWSLEHPYGTNWDEAEYLDEAAVDSVRLRSGALARFAGRILMKSWGRPPAYRLLADPFLAVFGFHASLARLVTFACFALGAWFIYLATSRVASRAAGAFAALIFCLCPEVFSSSRWYSTEGPLFLAIAAAAYFLFRLWTDSPPRSWNWIGLGAAAGLGLLAKTSFLLISLPVLAIAIVFGLRSRRAGSSLLPLLKATAVAAIVAGPWWAVNLRSSFDYTRYARDFVRGSLGSPSLSTFREWLGSVLVSFIGYGLAILIVLVLAAYIFQSASKRSAFPALQKWVLGACVCAGVPLVAAQLSGTNHLLRHISPAAIPLSIAAAIVADAAGFTRSRKAIAAAALLCSAQLAMILYPVLVPNTGLLDSGMTNGTVPWRVLIRHDQWDWNQVRSLADRCGVAAPMIGYLGDGRPLNQPQIELPWAKQGLPVDVQWLWRYEDGDLNWDKVTTMADESDFAITAPSYVGQIANKEDLDNRYNGEFARRLSTDSSFQKPIRFEMGRFEPVEVLVFPNRRLNCHAEAYDAANR